MGESRVRYALRPNQIVDFHRGPGPVTEIILQIPAFKSSPFENFLAGGGLPLVAL
jgi:hypothetical protein